MRKVIILLLCLLLVSCGTTNKSKSTTKDTLENSFFGVKKKVKEKLIYKKDKSINSFLNKYALFKKIVALGYLIQQKYRNDIRNMLP
jgi:PBP1b-binding outer membrane lipoprotein LpoB